MARNTKLSLGENAIWETVLRFIRVGGAGVVALVLLGLAGMAQTPEILLATALIVALDKYLRTKGFWEPVKTALKL